MTNIVANTTALPVRDAADAAHNGAREGRPFATPLGNLGSSFHNILYKGARIDANEMKASMSFVHSVAQDRMSAPEPDDWSRRSSYRDDASPSDTDTADDHDEWKAPDQSRETGTRDATAPSSDLNQPTADADSHVHDADFMADGNDSAILDLPLASAGTHSVKTATAANPDTGAADATADPTSSPNRGQETAQSPANSTQRADAHVVSNPANDGPDVSPESLTAARQADELAKSLPAGKDLKLNVTLSKPGESLFSLPASSLAAATVTGGQKIGSRLGQPAVGASALAASASAQNTTQVAAAAQSNVQANVQASVQANGGSSAGNPQFQTGTDGNQTNLAAAQPRSAGTPAPAPTSSFADVTGIGSSGASQGAPRGAPGALPTQSQSAPPQPPVAEQVSVQISKAVKAGIDRIDIQLRPKELGRVDVRLELTGDGRVSANVTVDNRETLELLKTDARGLERALADAGLKADFNSLNFNLRGQDGRQSGNQLSQSTQQGGPDGSGQSEIDDDGQGRALGDYSRVGVSADGRIDIEI